MQTQVVVDSELLQQALKAAGSTNAQAIVEAGLKLLIQFHAQTDVRRLHGKIHWSGDLDDLRASRLTKS
jgi:Arc/MetJ family transcription regulator